jgi:hypothetical protein
MELFRTKSERTFPKASKNIQELGTTKSDSTHHFFRNAGTKSESLRFSQFSGCWLILSVYILMRFDFPFVRLFGVSGRGREYTGRMKVVFCWIQLMAASAYRDWETQHFYRNVVWAQLQRLSSDQCTLCHDLILHPIWSHAQWSLAVLWRIVSSGRFIGLLARNLALLRQHNHLLKIYNQNENIITGVIDPFPPWTSPTPWNKILHQGSVVELVIKLIANAMLKFCCWTVFYSMY